MSSKTLTTRAVIQAVDNLTGPLGRMGAATRAFSLASSRHFAGIISPLEAAVAKLGSMPLFGHTMVAGLFGGSLMHDQIHLDKIARQTRAINETREQMWGFRTDQMLDLGTKFGISPEEMIKGAKSWQELGNSVESYVKNANIAAKTSKITGISIADQMTETSALVRAFGFDPKDHHMFREFERAYLVASKGMKGGAHAYGEAMKNFAPIAKSMGLNIHEASGFVQALGGQFEAGEIGNAFKMGFARLMAPTPKAMMALRGAGIDPLQFWKLDAGQLHGSGHAFAERLRGAGKVVSPELEAKLSKVFATADIAQGGRVLQDRLTKALAGEPGWKAGKGGNLAADDAKLATQAISQHLGKLRTGLNIPALFRAMSGEADNVPLIKELFGGHHIAKFQDLFRQGEHVAHQIEKNTKFAEQATYRTKFGLMWKEDVIDRRAKIVLEGLSHQFERMKAAWSGLWTGMGTRGFNKDVAGVFKGMADMLDGLRKTDPAKVRLLFWGLGGLAALPIATFALGAMAKSLAAVAALGMAPVRMLGALARVPYALAAAGLLRMGVGARLLGATMAGNALMGASRFAGVLGSIARFTAMGAALGGLWYAAENWQEIVAAFRGFSGTDAAKGMFASFSALGETAKGLGVDLVALTDSFFKFMGWRSEGDGGGGPVDTLATMAGWAKALADALNVALTAFRAIITDAEKLPSWMPEWMQGAHKANRDLDEQARRHGEGAGQAYSEGGFSGWLDYQLGRGQYDQRSMWERFAPSKPLFGDWTRPAPDALGVPGAFPANPFDRYQLADATGPVSTNLAADISMPIVDAEQRSAETVGSHVDASAAAIVSAIQALAPAMASAIAGAVSRASYGGPANASAPATGNATGTKR